LLFRAAYGGLKGDVAMLEGYARLWAARFFLTASAPAVAATAISGTSINAKMDMLLIPTLKFSLHHRYLVELSATGAPWGSRVVLAYANASQVPLRRQLHSSLTAMLQNTGIAIPPAPAVLVHPVRQLTRMFPLRAADLPLEGIDFHCEPDMVAYVLTEVGGAEALLALQDAKNEADSSVSRISGSGSTSDIQEAASQLIRNVIWMFRSSLNSRSVWELCNAADTAVNETYQRHSLQQKKRLARVWAAVAKPVRCYCQRRVSEVAARLKLAMATA
jgi:hypothetical protein